jgi:2-keto-4-pentenoate hydratase/2-oxohepta-3-ene-1,7-dioic acid hydratase in catechol pathway
MELFVPLLKLVSVFGAAMALGVVLSTRAEEIYCRVALPDGASRYAQVDGTTLRLLAGAPWAGGRATGATVPLTGAKLLPPTEPHNILCLANSYVGKEPHPPKFIRWFAKSAGAAATDGDPVEIPAAVDQLKSEVEVVLVVGRRLKNAGEAEAAEAIFGYTVGNEIFGFAESFQRVQGEDPHHPEPMLAAGLKLGDRFTPFGPFIHRGAEWPRAMRALTVTNAATGKRLEYSGDTQGFLYTPARMLSELSQVLTLEPGDIVFTGSTRALILDPGDDVTATIDGLGTLHNHIVK